MEPQAKRWTTRFKKLGIMNVYTYIENTELKILKFPTMYDEWLDFIIACRSGKSYEYDIVEGAMVDDTIFNYIQDFIDKRIDREKFWVMVKFKYPTHQISFHTARALDCLTFKGAMYVLFKISNSDLFFTCSLIEYIGRKTKTNVVMLSSKWALSN